MVQFSGSTSIRGYDLDGASAVWFDCDALKAKVVSVEEIRVTRDEEKKEKTNEKGERKEKAATRPGDANY